MRLRSTLAGLRLLPRFLVVLLAGVLVTSLISVPAHAWEEDKLPPIINVTPVNTTSWLANPITYQVVAVDNRQHDTGVETFTYELSGAHIGSGSLDKFTGGNLLISNRGVTQVRLQAMDQWGNISRYNFQVSLDLDNPDTSISLATNTQFMRGANAPVVYSCSDPGISSGMASCVGDVPSGSSLNTSTVGNFTFTVTAKDNAGRTKSTTVPYRVVAPGTMNVVSAPQVSGAAKVGTTLTGTPTVTNPASSTTCRWTIPGSGTVALGNEYLLPPEHLNRAITYSCASVLDGYDPINREVGPITIQPGDLAGDLVTNLALNGEGRPGETLTASYTIPQRPAGTLDEVRWLRDGADIGISGTTYVVKPTDRGHVLRAEVRVTRPGYNERRYLLGERDLTDRRLPIVTVTPAPNAGWLSGPVDYGLKATDDGPLDSGVAAFNYQLTGATTSSGNLDLANGGTVSVAAEGVSRLRATATDGAGNVGTADFQVRIDLTDPQTTLSGVRNGGTYAVGDVVPVTYSCADNQSGIDTCVGDVPSGSSIDTSTIGDRTFTVTATDKSGRTTSREVFYRVQAALGVDTPSRITGSGRVGGELVGVAPTFVPVAPSLCQWLRDGSVMTAVTGDRYTPVPSDIGKTLTYRCTGSLRDYADRVVESAGVKVAYGHLPDGLVVDGAVAGVAEVGQTLTASYRIPDRPEGLVDSVIWLRSDVVIQGATGTTYILRPVDLGHVVRAVVVLNRDGYFPRQERLGERTLKDELPPLVQVSPAPIDGWLQDSVTYGLKAVDDRVNDSGVRWFKFEQTGAHPAAGDLDIVNGGETTIEAEGITRVLVSARDNADNVGTADFQVRIDLTDPRASVANLVEGAELTQGQELLVSYECADDQSGIASCVGDVADGEALDTSTVGAHTFQVVATDRSGRKTTRRVNYEVVEAEELRLQVVTPAQITGSGRVGAELSGTPAVYEPTAEVTCVWRDADGALLGEGVAYIPVAADLGKTITFECLGVLDGYADEPSVSVGRIVVAGELADDLVTDRRLAGSRWVGETLTAEYTIADRPADLEAEVVWLRDGDVIEGATGATYVIRPGDLDHRILAELLVTRPGYTDRSYPIGHVDVVEPLDELAPVISVDPEPHDGWLREAITYHLTATDDRALDTGVSTFGYELSGATEDSGDLDVAEGGDITVGAEGRTEARVTATDGAGNSKVLDFDVRVDLTDPELNLNGVVNNDIYALDQVVDVDIACADDQSGIDTCVSDSEEFTKLDTDTVGEHTLTATATDRSGRTTAQTVHYRVVDGDPRLNVAFPATVDGSGRIGEELVASPAIYSPSALATCVWVRDGESFGSVGMRGYTPVAADLGATLAYSCMGTLDGYPDEPSVSEGTVVVRGELADGLVTERVLDGVGQVGKTLTASYTIVDRPGDLEAGLVWLRDDEVIEGARGTTYDLRPGDVGHRVRAVLDLTRPGYDGRRYPIGHVDVAAGRLQIVTPPVFSGSGRVGEELAGTPPTFLPDITPACQWFRDGVWITDEGVHTYIPTADDLGADLTFECLGELDGYVGEIASSEALTVQRGELADGLVVDRQLDGAGRVGATLRASYSIVNRPADLETEVVWLRDDEVIEGATGATYVAVEADLGHTVRAVLDVTRPGYVERRYPLGHVDVTDLADELAPVVSVDPEPTDGWLQDPTTYHLTAADNRERDTGVRWFEYELSGASEESGSLDVHDGGDVTVENEGTTRVLGTAIDAAGNVGTADFEVKLDLTDPSAEVSGLVEGAELALDQEVLVSYTCADAVSGIDTCVGDVADGEAIDTSTVGAHSFKVVATDDAGRKTTRAIDYTVVEGEELRLQVTTPAGITGSGRVGEELTGTPAIYEPTAEVTCVWRDADGALLGEGDAYTPVAADLGKTITFECLGVLDGYADEPSVSVGRIVVAGELADGLITEPALAGVGEVGETLTASYSIVDRPGDLTAEVVWLRDGEVIEDAAGATYVVRQADVGHTVRAALAVTRPGYDPRRYPIGHVDVVEPDRQAPVVTVAPEPTDDWLTEAIPYHLGASDDTGVESFGYVLSGAAESRGDLDVVEGGDVTVENEGTTRVLGTAIDAAGNVGTADFEVKLDLTDPSAEVSGLVEGAELALDQEVLVSYTCADAVSGIDTCVGDVADGEAIDTTTVGENSFRVVATDDAGRKTTRVVDYTVVEGEELRLQVTTPAGITGSGRVGVELTGTPAIYEPTAEVTCVWRDGDGALLGEGDAYTPVAADLGKTITFECLGVLDGYADEPSVSVGRIVVAGELADGLVTEPALAGVGEVGETLTASYLIVDRPEDLTAEVVWLRDGEVIADATGATYVVAEADLGHTVRAVLDVTRPGYGPRRYPIGHVDVAEPADELAPVVTVTPKPTDGWLREAITYHLGATDDRGVETFGYEMSGATEETGSLEIIKGGDIEIAAEGTTQVTATAADAAGNVGTADFEVKLDLTDPSAEVSGLVEGAELALDQEVLVSYECADALSGVALCDGDVASGGVIDTSTVGAHSFKVVATDNAGRTTSRTWNYTVVEDEELRLQVTTPAGITGSGRVGEELSGVPAVFEPTAEVTCVWRDGDGALLGEGDAYTPVAADLGKTITFECLGVLDGYADEPSVSVGRVVVAGELADGLVTERVLEGVGEVGETLTASYSIVDRPGDLTAEVVWLRDGEVIEGASGATYVVVAADLGHTVRAVLDVTRSGYADRRYPIGHVEVADPDGQAPVVTVDPKPTHGWLTEAISYHLRATDDRGVESFGYVLSGVTAGRGDLDVVEGGDVEVAAEGITSVIATATDAAGNRGRAEFDVHLDLTDPSAEVSGLVEGAELALGQEVLVTYECADAVSGIESCEGDVASGAAIDTTTVGENSFRVVATDDAGRKTTRVVDYTVVEGEELRLQVTTPAGITGSGRVGVELTGTPAIYEPTAEVTCVWRDGDGALLGEGDAYTPVAADLGKTITFECLGVLDGYADEPSVSVGRIVVAGELADGLVTEPALAGVGEVGETLTASYLIVDRPEDLTAEVVWLRDGEVIADATGATYVVAEADLGHTVRAVLDVTRPGYDPRRYPLGHVDVTEAVLDTETSLELSGESAVVRGAKLSATAAVEVVDGSAPQGELTITVDGEVVDTQDAGDGDLSVELPNGAVAAERRVVASFAPTGVSQASSDASDSYEVVAADTTTTVTEPDGPVSAADSVAVRVAAVDSAVVPTGDVNVTGDGVEGTVELTDGEGVFELAGLVPGEHELTFTYAGDGSTNGSSDTVTVLVKQATGAGETSTELSLDRATAPIDGQKVVATASVTVPEGESAAGKVVFMVGDWFRVVALEGATATLELPVDELGTYQVQATYLGTGTLNSSSSAERSYEVVKADTTTTVTEPDGPVSADESLTVQVAAVDSTVVPAGDVSVTGEGVEGTVALDAAGQGAFGLAGLVPGEHELTFTYAGDGGTNGSSDTVTVVVKQTAGTGETSTELSLDRATAPIDGQKVVATASVAVPEGENAAGKVVFMVGDSAKVVALEGATATLELPVDNLGTVEVQAIYLGTGTLNSSTSAERSYEVVKADTTTTVSEPDGPVSAADSVAVRVAAVDSAVVPTGDVNVTGDGVEGTVELTDGEGVFELAGLVPGEHELTFTYAGSTTTNTSSDTVTVTIAEVVKVDTTTTVTEPAGPLGTDESLSVRVAAVDSPVVPAGDVNVTGDGVEGTVELTDGEGVFELAGLVPGEHELTFTYAGDGSTSGSSDTVTVVVKQTAGTGETSTELSLDRATAPIDGQRVVATASVTVPEGESAAGKVAFLVGNWFRVVALEGATATLELPVDELGTVEVQAIYLGTGTLNSSTSEERSYEVVKADTTTTVSEPDGPVSADESLTVQVAAVDSTVVPTGDVNVTRAGVEDITTIALNAEGEGVFELADLEPGEHELTFTYAGSAETNTSRDTVTVTIAGEVVKVDTTTTVTEPAGPLGTDESLAVQVAAVDSTVVPTGDVNVTGAGGVGGTVELTDGEGVFELAGLVPGEHELTFTYAGDGSTNGSSDTVTVLVKQTSGTGDTSTELSLDRSIAPVQGTTVRATASITVPEGESAAGKVLFMVGDWFRVVALDGATATLELPVNALGTYRVQAIYLGTGTLNSSTSAERSYEVVKAETRVVATVPDGEIESSVSVPVAVSAVGSPVVPTGALTVREGGKDLATLGLVDGKATYPLAALAPGSHALEFGYAGDANTSPSVQQVTVVVKKFATTTTLALDRITTTAGGLAVTATATVAATGGAAPDGQVSVVVDGTVFATNPVGAAPVKVVLPIDKVGGHTVALRYSGSASTAVSESASMTYTVAKAKSTVKAKFKKAKRKKLKVTATVTSTTVVAGKIQVLQTVKVKKGKKVKTKTKVVGTGTIKTVGKTVTVTFTTKKLTKGRQKFTVRYLGSESVLVSTKAYKVKVK